MGLKAMQDLQSLNPDQETASDAQILFLVLNTSADTLLPVTIICRCLAHCIYETSQWQRRARQLLVFWLEKRIIQDIFARFQ